MNTIIRKISVGPVYPDGAIHYQVGSTQRLKDKRYKITHILLDTSLLELGKLAYNIYVENIPEDPNQPISSFLWKQVVDVPCVIENNINFE